MKPNILSPSSLKLMRLALMLLSISFIIIGCGGGTPETANTQEPLVSPTAVLDGVQESNFPDNYKFTYIFDGTDHNVTASQNQTAFDNEVTVHIKSQPGGTADQYCQQIQATTLYAARLDRLTSDQASAFSNLRTWRHIPLINLITNCDSIGTSGEATFVLNFASATFENLALALVSTQLDDKTITTATMIP